MMTKGKRKALGQHFLSSRPVLKKIVSVISPHKEDLVIEIGAGKGALTLPLTDSGARVIAVEKDKTLIPFLVKMKKENLTVLEKDVLNLDFRELIREEKKPGLTVKLAGNLPYSISTPLLFRVLEVKDLVSVCVFLFQREVAERIAASPGTKKYAPLSILFQIDWNVTLHFIVPAGAFSPPPEVESALVSLKRRESPLFKVEEEDLFKKFLRTAFAQRRKTLLNNLKNYPFPAYLIKEALQKHSLEQNLRAEQVPIAQMVGLFRTLHAGSSRGRAAKEEIYGKPAR